MLEGKCPASEDVCSEAAVDAFKDVREELFDKRRDEVDGNGNLLEVIPAVIDDVEDFCIDFPTPVRSLNELSELMSMPEVIAVVWRLDFKESRFGTSLELIFDNFAASWFS